MGDTSQQHKILALVCLLLWGGGVLIDNENDHSNNSLTALSLLASTQRIIQTDPGAGGNGAPIVCFLLRNFDEEEIRIHDEVKSTAQFLDFILENKNDHMDSVRQIIKDCFPYRMLHTLPTPSREERHSEELPPGGFQNAFVDLREKVISAATSKKVGGAECDGEIIVQFLEECVRTINERGNVTMESAVVVIMNSVCSRHADASFARYQQTMKPTNFTGDDAQLQQQHNQVLQEAIEQYNTLTQGLLSVSTEKYRQELQQRIGRQYDLYREQNQRKKAEQDAEQQRQRADQEQQRAETERQRADTEQQRADKLQAEQAEQARLQAEQAEQAKKAEQDKRTFSNRSISIVKDTSGNRGKFGGKTKYQVVVQDDATGIQGNMGNNDTREAAEDWSKNSLKEKLLAEKHIDC